MSIRDVMGRLEISIIPKQVTQVGVFPDARLRRSSVCSRGFSPSIRESLPLDRTQHFCAPKNL
ncbi:hypothetical protein GLYMA_01G192800v4 [Glycine max]|uniref:Uncharacterized protein n=2 Tax=Glycine subgen. Soja TaxID=1462606 RepID=K7K4Q1_SOYBN|nr:hypothetical protein JHK87_002275 [Glycine soja]KAG5069959.1 hypothetical protein JHK85_002336 [Glycine max]KAH1163889.1 hypothetical protein GYH30_002090 [Glycine max]KHN36289.1 hypothetical protein glysoja_003412 [Glycine soja]KRH77110.1 hypothetical protein GLYMA_01G192800v4 [Glycine max]